MPAKPNADEVLDKLTIKADYRGRNPKELGLTNHATIKIFGKKQAKQTMMNDLLSMLPKRKNIGSDDIGDIAYERGLGRNQAIDQAEEAIRMYFSHG